MKKTSLLFTILCVSTLNGMEVTRSDFYELPREIKTLIFSYIKEFNSPDEIISAIKAISLVNKELNKIINETYDSYSLKGFTALVYILAEKFNTSTYNVAKEFNTEVSKEYLDLGTQLGNAIKEKDTAKVAELISQDADVNFMENPWRWIIGGKYRGNTALITAVIYQNPAEIVKLLLDAGANPNLESHVFEALFKIFKNTAYSQEISKIRTLLEQARKR